MCVCCSSFSTGRRRKQTARHCMALECFEVFLIGRSVMWFLAPSFPQPYPFRSQSILMVPPPPPTPLSTASRALARRLPWTPCPGPSPCWLNCRLETVGSIVKDWCLEGAWGGGGGGGGVAREPPIQIKVMVEICLVVGTLF